LAWRRPPLGLGASLPVARKDFISLTTKATDTLNSAAAARHDRTTLDKAGNKFTKIERIGFRHSESPPGGSESQAPPQENPPRVDLTIRRSRSGMRLV
jgi:hypothetical protein